MTQPELETFTERSQRLDALLRELSPEHRAVVECLDSDRAVQVRTAERHGAALMQLQEASIAIVRVLESDAIELELARHATRVAGAEGAVVARVARVASDESVVAAHWRSGELTTDPPPDAVVAAIGEVVRTGRVEHETGLFALPVRVGHRTDRVLAVYGFDPVTGFDLGDILVTLCATAGATLGSAAMLAGSIRDRRESDALAELARALGSSQRLGEVLHLGLRHSMALLGAEGADIALVRSEHLHVVAAVGCSAPAQGVYVPIRQCASGRAMLDDRALVANDNSPDGGANPLVRAPGTVEKFVSVPMRMPHGPIGVLSVVNRPADFTADDVRVLERLASHLAIAVVKVRLFEEADEATRELQAAFDAIAGGIAVVDADGFVLRHNARLGVVAGVGDSADLRGHSLYELILGEPRNPVVDEPIGVAVLRRVVGRGTMRSRTGDQVYEVVASPHPQGGAVVTVDDVTSFVKMTERYRLVVESTTDAIFTMDSACVITSANGGCEQSYGLPRDEIVGRRLAAMVDPGEAVTVASASALALGGQPVQFECSVTHADGTSRLMSFSFSPIGAGGEVTGLIGIARDVTEQRAQAAALERAETRYARLVEAAEDGICTLDEEGTITSANRSFCRIVRVPRAQIVGRHLADLVPEGQRAGVWAMFGAALSGARQRGEVRYVSHLGNESVVSVRMAPLVERDTISGTIAIVRDMTDERAMSERAARQDKLAALGELVGGVAHEVNTPLTGILAHAQLLQSDLAPDSDARRAVDTIVNEARRAARIVGKLLAFARQNPSEHIPTDINQVLLDTLELRRYALRMQHVQLGVDLAPGLPTVWADPFQLQQVFINLLSNAEKAVVEGGGSGGRIEVSSARGNQGITVSVSDSGAGIAPEHLPHIFNPFYTTKPRGIGTGLGLSISFAIVREHGGFIQAASLPERGATFTVHLPVRDAQIPLR